MKSFTIFAGIDVSKLSLDIYVLNSNDLTSGSHFKASNSLEGLNAILRHLSVDSVKNGCVFFCFEDTGVYSMPLCYFFEQKSIPYACVPAIKIKKSMGLKRGKTDKHDARDIALYAKTHVDELRLRQLPLIEIQELKVLLSEREKLVKSIKMFKSSQEAIGFLDKKTLKNLIKSNSKTVLLLEKQLKEIDEMIREVIEQHQLIKHQKHLLEILGIGPQTAMFLIVYSNCFNNFDNWRQMACYAGVAPFPYQSGTSIHGRTKVSPLAQKKLKSLLNMGALTAVKYDKELAGYYARKAAEGKNKMSVLNAVRCKLLARAFAVINRNSPFVDMRKYAA